MNRAKEIAKFACGAEAFHTFVHGYLWLSGTTLDVSAGIESVTRTALTISVTAVALFVFAFVGAIQEGIDRLAHDQQADPSLVVFQANRFCPSTSKLQDGYADRIRKIEGVKDAVPIKVYMNNCRASLDVVVFNGMPPQKPRAFRDLALLQGDWSTFEKQREAALVGQSIFERGKLPLGQKFFDRFAHCHRCRSLPVLQLQPRTE